MMTVYKYPVTEVRDFSLAMPSGAKFLKMDWQHGKLVMWWHVDLSNPFVTRQFMTVGTGLESAHVRNWQYLDSYQLLEGKFVGHLFVGQENAENTLRKHL